VRDLIAHGVVVSAHRCCMGSRCPVSRLSVERCASICFSATLLQRTLRTIVCVTASGAAASFTEATFLPPTYSHLIPSLNNPPSLLSRSADNTRLACGSGDGTVWIWNRIGISVGISVGSTVGDIRAAFAQLSGPELTWLGIGAAASLSCDPTLPHLHRDWAGLTLAAGFANDSRHAHSCRAWRCAVVA
jgi:hypothetical protein